MTPGAPTDLQDPAVIVDPPAARILRAALDVSPDGFAVHRVRRDVQGRAVGFTVEVINAAGAAPHAAGPADIVGRDLVDLLPEGEATGIPAAFRAAADTGRVQELRTAFDSEDWSGTMDLLVARVDQDRIVATWRDVTQLVRSEQVVVDAYTRAQAAWDCLYSVLDAVQDDVLLVDARTGRGGASSATAGDTTSGNTTPGSLVPTLVVEYLNAAATGGRDRIDLVGQRLSEVRPDLDSPAVINLVIAAASDPAGCVRHLVLSRTDGVEIGSFTASRAPVVASHTGVGQPDGSDGGTRSVVLVVRRPPRSLDDSSAGEQHGHHDEPV